MLYTQHNHHHYDWETNVLTLQSLEADSIIGCRQAKTPIHTEVNLDNLESRVQELEMKVAFQDGTIEELDQQVIKLNKALATQQDQLRLLVSKLQAVEPSNMASQADETPPPHY